MSPSFLVALLKHMTFINVRPGMTLEIQGFSTLLGMQMSKLRSKKECE